MTRPDKREIEGLKKKKGKVRGHIRIVAWMRSIGFWCIVSNRAPLVEYLWLWVHQVQRMKLLDFWISKTNVENHVRISSAKLLKIFYESQSAAE